jgi:hypothetical protein
MVGAPGLQWSWRHAQLSRKTDALSTLARQMDAPVALVRQYGELTWGQRASSEAGEPTPGADDREAMWLTVSVTIIPDLSTRRGWGSLMSPV